MPLTTSKRFIVLPLLIYMLAAAAPASASGNAALSESSGVTAQRPAESSGVTAQRPAVEIVRECEPSVVAVVGKLSKLSRDYSDMSSNIVHGSGIVYKSNGYIVTNHHVVDGCEKLFVVLSDKRIYEARVVGADEASDIALIKIEKGMLKPVVFADSAAVETGAPVITIGTPVSFDLYNSVGVGVISGIDRYSVFTEYYCLQTDATANQGNSGGPIIDMEGRTLGIIAVKYADFSNITLCITSHTIQYIVPQLLRYGRVRRPDPGGKPEQSLMADFGLSGNQGLYITEITEDGPMAEAGVTGDDMLLAINGSYLSTYLDYTEELKNYAPGDTVELTLRRGNNIRTVQITFAEKE